jgi:hypothetical protein
MILFLGLTLLALLIFQMLTGLRVITFHGATHRLVHRWAGFAILGIGAVHATIAIGFLFFGWF